MRRVLLLLKRTTIPLLLRFTAFVLDLIACVQGRETSSRLCLTWRLSVGLMLWLRPCSHWKALLFALLACTIDVCASSACVHASLISADSFALLTSLSNVFQLVTACHTWMSIAITADDETCPWNATKMEPERELSQLPLPGTPTTSTPSPEKGEFVDGQEENESNVDAVKR